LVAVAGVIISVATGIWLMKRMSGSSQLGTE
jgi:hypothetical protein